MYRTGMILAALLYGLLGTIALICLLVGEWLVALAVVVALCLLLGKARNGSR